MALAVSAFTLSVIFALLPVGLNSNKAAIEQTAAAGIARCIVADLRAVQPAITAATSTGFIIPIPPVGTQAGTVSTIFLCEDGTPTSDATSARYRATVMFYPPSLGRTATMVSLLISWPALAEVNAPLNGNQSYTGSFEVAFALDRN